MCHTHTSNHKYSTRTNNFPSPINIYSKVHKSVYALDIARLMVLITVLEYFDLLLSHLYVKTAITLIYNSRKLLHIQRQVLTHLSKKAPVDANFMLLERKNILNIAFYRNTTFHTLKTGFESRQVKNFFLS
jgi:hypothetical protein